MDPVRKNVYMLRSFPWFSSISITRAMESSIYKEQMTRVVLVIWT